MATLKVYQYARLESDGDELSLGSLVAPVDITVDGKLFEGRKSLATATTYTAWTAGDVISNWDFLWIKSDQSIKVELTVDYGNEVGTILIPLIVTANAPLMISYDDALAVYTAAFATGTADVIDRIKIRNDSGSTANIRVVLIT